MKDAEKTKKELIKEIEILHTQVLQSAQLEAGNEKKTEGKTAEQAVKSEEYYKDLYDEAPNVYLSVGTDGRIIRANRRAVELYDYSLDQLIGMPVFNLGADTPAGKEKMQIIFQRFLAGDEIHGEELQFRNANGQLLWISLSVRPIRNSEGKIVASRSIAEDITHRKEMEQALRESEERYRDLYEEAPCACVLIGIDSHIMRANPRTVEMFGYPLVELVGQSVFSLHPDTPTGKAKAQKLFQGFLAGEDIRDGELEFSRKDGRSGWMSLSVRPIRNPAGQIVAGLCIAIDITDRKLAEQALHESEEQLARILESAMDAIITIDHRRRITLLNTAAVKVLRCPPAELIGQSLDRFLSERFRSLFTKYLEGFERSDETKNYMWAPEGLTAIRANGEEFPVEGTISQMELRGKKLYTVILRDINERKRAEAQLRTLQQENLYLQEEIKTQLNFEEIVGASATIKKVLGNVEIVAGTGSTVLLTGETGTGKELIARAIHSRSSRKNKALIKVNCAALPTGLIESELFGHEKGAFTGAISKKIGRFELADKGTIFLDEIGEIPLEIQTKLLRVLQEGEFERVGGTQTIRVDVRVICATNRDLEKAVAENKFRADLFYRINVFPVHLPALRERKEDVPLLVHYFVNKHMIKMGKRIEKIDLDTMRRFLGYSWPGNIRELENIVERAVILSKSPSLHIEEELFPSAKLEEQKEKDLLSLEEIERNHIMKALKETHGVIDGPKGAAIILNVHPNTLRSRMKKLSIDRRSYRSSHESPNL